MIPRRVVVAVAVVLSASACFSPPFVDPARISCATNGDCPSSARCAVALKHCVGLDTKDQTPPALDDVAVDHDQLGLGATAVVTATASEPLGTDPVVTSGDAVFVLDEGGTDRRHATYAFHTTTSGTEAQGTAPLHFVLVDRAGNPADVDGPNLTLDFDAPVFTALDWSAPPAAVGAHAILDVAGATEAGAVLVSARLLGDGSVDIAAPVEASIAPDGTVSARFDLAAPGVQLGALASVGVVVAEVIAADAAGNASTSAVSRTPSLPVDVIPPTSPRIDTEPVARSEAITVHVDASGATRVRFGGDIVDDGAFVDASFPADLPLTLAGADGNKSVTAIFADDAGNESAPATASIVLNRAADNVPPHIVSATATAPTIVTVAFSEPVSFAGGIDAADFAIAPALAVSGAATDGTRQLVTLITAGQVAGESYVVVVDGAVDDGANPLASPDNAAAFTGFGIVDHTSPDLLAPDDGALAFALDGSHPSATLVWSARAGASSYEVQVARDTAFTDLVLDDVTAADVVSRIVTLPDASTFYWRVAADITAPGFGDLQYPSRVLEGMDDVVRVACPAAAPSCDAGGVGNITKPLLSINRGIEAAQTFDLHEVDVASRGAARDVAHAYDEVVTLAAGVSVLGGFEDTFTAARDPVLRPTTITNDGIAEVLGIDLQDDVNDTRFDGFAVRPHTNGNIRDRTGMLLQDCGANVTVSNVDVDLGGVFGNSIGVNLIQFDGTFSDSTITGATHQGDFRADNVGLRLDQGRPHVVRNTISAGQAVNAFASNFNRTYALRGIAVNTGAPLIEDNTVFGGSGRNDPSICNPSCPNQVGFTSTALDYIELDTNLGVVRNNVFITGTATESRGMHGSALGATGFVAANNTFVITAATGLAVGADTSNRGAFVNNIFVVTGAGGAPIGMWFNNVSLGTAEPASVQNNAFIGFPTTMVFEDFSGNQNPVASVTSMESTLRGIDARITASGNVSLANAAAAFFADTAGNDFHLTASSPASLLQLGHDASGATCGFTNAPSSCGAVVDDFDGGARACPDAATSCYAIGAYEP